MAEPMDGQIVVELPTYSPAFKEVYRFIVEATNGDIQAATDLFLKYLAGGMPEGYFLSRVAGWKRSKQALTRARYGRCQFAIGPSNTRVPRAHDRSA